MKSEDFISAYESALATQDWTAVEPLISPDASVTFSDGSIHSGKQKVTEAFERNFNSIKSEKYEIVNVNWLKRTDEFAVYTFEFNWTGIINGNSVSGVGVGTSVIIMEAEGWKLLREHLGRKA